MTLSAFRQSLLNLRHTVQLPASLLAALCLQASMLNDLAQSLALILQA